MSEQWEYGGKSRGVHVVLRTDTGAWIADFRTEALARQAIADHDAARDLADAVDALDDARRALGTGDCTVTDCEGCKEDAAYARNAIADFFAAHPDLTAEGRTGR